MFEYQVATCQSCGITTKRLFIRDAICWDCLVDRSRRLVLKATIEEKYGLPWLYEVEETPNA